MKKLQYDNAFLDDFGNAVGFILGRGQGPTLLLITHMDTVPLPSGLSSQEPWMAAMNGRLFGPGAADCKGGMAAQVFAGGLLKRSLLPLEGNLVVAATVAEECGRSLGVKGLIEKTLPELGFDPACVVLGEPTNLGLYYGHDGWVAAEITVTGEDLFQVSLVKSTILDDLLGAMGGDSTDERAEELVVREVSGHQTEGPFSAAIEVGRRLRSGEEVADALDQLERQAAQIAELFGGVSVSAQVPHVQQQAFAGSTAVVQKGTPPWYTDPHHPLLKRACHALAAIGNNVHLGKWRLDRQCLGSAGRVLTNQFHLPTIGYGPGREEVAHNEDEFVEIEKIQKALFGTAVIAYDLIGIPVYEKGVG
ncbi:MAG: M20/M25/M40 family metallo-hydrolase [Candidatus Latescibacteria bacterium]|nr:M20/M25/M40 family metallo-hydrolase [Candidatus Latescibacterota bacterium]